MSVEKPICPHTRGEYLWAWACRYTITFMCMVPMLSWPGFYFEPWLNSKQACRHFPLLVCSWNPTFDLHWGEGEKKRSAKLYIIIIDASAWFLWPCVGVFLTRCRRQHVRGVPEPHEIKLVKPPVLLVRSGHWVLPPLVHDLVSRVAIWEPHRGERSRMDDLCKFIQ